MLAVARNLYARTRASRVVTRMRKDSRSGSAIVEFAFIAPIFFLLIFAIIETGIMYFSQATLQFATAETARLVRTGQVQSGAMNAAGFRTQVCNIVTPLLACDSNLQIDVRTFANFSGAGFGDPLDSAGNLKSGQNNFQPGNAGDVVLVRVFYTWKVMTPILTPFLINMANDNHLLTGTAAFRNEPF